MQPRGRSASRFSRLLPLLLAVTATASCGASTGVGAPGETTDPLAHGADATAPADLPIVDLSKQPISNDPDPVVRSGPAADFVECEFGVQTGGWALDFGPMGEGPDPDAAVRAALDDQLLVFPDEFDAVGRDGARVLFVHAVDGVGKGAIIVADTSVVDLDADGQWAVETFAGCDPAEFDPASTTQFVQTVWEDSTGNRMPTSIITSSRGPEHCDWQSATILTLNETTYISDPEGVFGDTTFSAEFDDDATLPADTVDTGYRVGDTALWLASDASVAFVVTNNSVELWPSPTSVFGCM